LVFFRLISEMNSVIPKCKGQKNNDQSISDSSDHLSLFFNNKMWKILLCAFLFQRFESVLSSVKSIPRINNVSLVMFNSNSTIINGTCQQCLCSVLLNTTSFSSFNCFSSNNTCQMFSQPLVTGSFMLVNDTRSSFYFFSWPIDDTTLTTSECHFFKSVDIYI
jgi:hypothetical protein